MSETTNHCYYYDEQRNRCNCYVNENLDELLAENAKLVDVLHEVETEAVYAYNCLQQDCVTTANSSEHFFKKWWHAECELDQAKAENAKLRELLIGMAERVTNPVGGCLAPGCALGCPHHLECDEELRTCWYVDRLRELGIEV